MMAVMFIAFLVQIVFRYILNFPIGWTSELTIIMWLWLVLFGAAFIVREREEIRFDLIYSNVGRKVRNVMAVVGAIALIAIYAFSFPAVADYVLFMKVQSTAYLKIRFDWLFSIYLLFVVAIIARYCWILLGPVHGQGSRGIQPDRCGVRRMIPMSPLTLCITAIVVLSLLGLPIGHAMIAASILYLLAAGLDMGTAAEQILNGMYTSHVLLAVPLFILAAEIMNSGSLTERLLRILQRHRRPLPRRAGAGQCRAEHHLRRHVGLGHRRCRRQRQR